MQPLASVIKAQKLPDLLLYYETMYCTQYLLYSADQFVRELYYAMIHADVEKLDKLTSTEIEVLRIILQLNGNVNVLVPA